MKHRQTNIGSLRKREVTQPQQHTEYYLFNSQGNLKAYSDDIMSFAYYGYNAANTRTYKLSLYNTNLWINGQQQPLNMQLQNAMFYPNTYLNFNGNGEYTKHYYNGMERIASRLGDNTTTIAINSNILEDRKLQVEDRFKEDIQELISEPTQVDMPPMLDILNLQPTGTPNDIYYYHPNHLGSTSFVTDNNATITQGFLYAPFGEITTEFNINFGSSVIPKYSFNAKELDEETGMYYYEARYYKSPVFTSRDPMFEKYFWMSPYAYCANNPVKYVDPTGREVEITGEEEEQQQALEDLRNAAPNLKLKYEGNKLIIGEGGVAETEYEKHLAEAINSSEFKSVISLEENDDQPGSYYGTKFDEKNNQYVSLNKVNIQEMRNKEGEEYVKGSGLMHEITEGLEMGKIAKANGLKQIDKALRQETTQTIGAGNSQVTIPITRYGKDYHLYELGHGRATPQPGDKRSKPEYFFSINKK